MGSARLSNQPKHGDSTGWTYLHIRIPLRAFQVMGAKQTQRPKNFIPCAQSVMKLTDL